MKPKISKILISRTDSIGDVMLTLPMCGWLKKTNPEIEIHFLGKNYTIPILKRCEHIDYIWNWDDELKKENPLKEIGVDMIIHVLPNKIIAKAAKNVKIPIRLGTYSRFFHWFTCNKLSLLNRKNSQLHEAQLNLRLLKNLGYNRDLNLNEISCLFGFKANIIKSKVLSSEKFNLILHPKSQGSAREWPVENYLNLIQNLDKQIFNIIICGTEKESLLMEGFLHSAENLGASNLCGKLSLDEYIDLIASSDALLACSTGPLHIAAALGIHAIGIYPPMKPLHPGRWAPIGKNAKTFVLNKDCNGCNSNCTCMKEIKPIDIINFLTTINN